MERLVFKKCHCLMPDRHISELFACYIWHDFLSPADFFFRKILSYRVSYNLDLCLGPNCLRRLSEDDTSLQSVKEMEKMK